jgi:hypothetical protein
LLERTQLSRLILTQQAVQSLLASVPAASLTVILLDTQEDLTPLERHRRQKGKKGGALEFMQLLTSLTRRW